MGPAKDHPPGLLLGCCHARDKLHEPRALMLWAVKISSRGVPLRDTLHGVLGPLGLAYYARGGLLVIGTKDGAEWLTQEDRSLRCRRADAQQDGGT
jgi:hypothetical protein